MSTQASTFPGPPVRFESGQSTDERLLALWRRMMTIRIHEQIIEELNARGLIRGSTHLYIGMEACAVGAVAAFSEHDIVLGYYRSHGHALAKGVPARAVISEVLGRVTGCCGGRAGTKHLMDVSRNYLGAYAIVGQQLALATGVALAVKRAVVTGGRAPSIVACFFGDGAINQGVAMEALNLASVMKLPCLFVCENNQYAVSTPARQAVGGGSIAGRAAGFGIPAKEVDGMDVLKVHRATSIARRQILSSGVPAFLELRTYRYRGHSVFQTEDGYRDPAELERYKARDPIKLLERRLAKGGFDCKRLDSEREQIARRLREDAEWATQQPTLSEISQDEVRHVELEGLMAWGGAA